MQARRQLPALTTHSLHLGGGESRSDDPAARSAAHLHGNVQQGDPKPHQNINGNPARGVALRGAWGALWSVARAALQTRLLWLGEKEPKPEVAPCQSYVSRL